MTYNENKLESLPIAKEPVIKSLTTKQFLGLIILAIGFWYNGVYLISFISKNDWWSGWPLFTIFAISLPIAIMAISGLISLMKLRSDQTLPVVSLVVGLVAIMHTAALLGRPQLYQIYDNELIPYIWLLWFCGIVLIPTTFKKLN
jgi:hypothetical protein